MNIIRTLSTLMLATMVISGAAMAEGEKLADKLSNSVIIVDIDVRGCEADSAILCPGLPLNSRKSFMCLMAYEDNLSLSCELGIAEAAMTLEQGLMAIDYSIKACEADADKFCLDVEPGEGRIVSCLKQNEAKLANQCVTALKETGLWNIDAQ
ncbi:MAG: cysteine rich repeat-containing protein [Gammaproteobacteria bacterium]